MALRQEFTRLHDDVDLDRDRALVERCQAGDAGAFGSLYARYYERLLRLCLRRLHDRHEAEDAAQEAFARAWKALPNFAGERHFYPWLTVIAGNVCTDTLRRRSHSTPTADTELGARLPVGAAGNATADEVLIASVDGELVHKALDRLSVRHRDVLAMREGSGWTYQQIADHEGVEIGTIETLLWRARQALKREFNALAESKGALAGFLIGSGALIRNRLARAVHRGTTLTGGGGSGLARNAFAGVAVTSAAVAAAFIAPHAFDSAPAARAALPAPATAWAAGAYAARSPASSVAGGTAGAGDATAAGASSASVSTNVPGVAAPTTGSGGALSTGGTSLTPVTGLTGTLHPQSLLGPILNSVSGGSAAASGTSAVTPTVSGLGDTVSGLGTTVGGLGTTVSGLGNAVSGLGTGVSGLGNAVSGLGTGVSGLGNAVTGLGQALGSTASTIASTPVAETTTPTTLPITSVVAPVASTVTSTVHQLLGQG